MREAWGKGAHLPHLLPVLLEGVTAKLCAPRAHLSRPGTDQTTVEGRGGKSERGQGGIGDKGQHLLLAALLRL